MPFVNLKIAGPKLESEQLRPIQRSISKLMVKALSKKIELTAVLVEQCPIDRRTIRSESLPVAANLEAKITARTNSVDETGRYVFWNAPLTPIWVVIGLAMGPAVALGLARFAYALLLPPMRASLGWSFADAGAMNTAMLPGIWRVRWWLLQSASDAETNLPLRWGCC